MEEEQLCKNRFIDLASKSYNNNTYTYTAFLNAGEIDLLLRCSNEISFVGYTINGGRELSERCVACFGNEEELGYSPSFPILLIKVSPLIDKFSDEFTHRDFLGAVLNLGIERNTIGDIIIKNNKGYIYCLSGIADFIVKNLDKVKHTHVKCEITDLIQEEVRPEFEELKLIAASNRSDAVIAALTKLSRSKTVELFSEKKIFINSKITGNNDYQLKPGDVISVRGTGKFIYDGISHETKKGRVSINIRKYV